MVQLYYLKFLVETVGWIVIPIVSHVVSIIHLDCVFLAA